MGKMSSKCSICLTRYERTGPSLLMYFFLIYCWRAYVKLVFLVSSLVAMIVFCRGLMVWGTSVSYAASTLFAQ